LIYSNGFLRLVYSIVCEWSGAGRKSGGAGVAENDGAERGLSILCWDSVRCHGVSFHARTDAMTLILGLINTATLTVTNAYDCVWQTTLGAQLFIFLV